jgi:hypothetical protein
LNEIETQQPPSINASDENAGKLGVIFALYGSRRKSGSRGACTDGMAGVRPISGRG